MLACNRLELGCGECRPARLSEGRQFGIAESHQRLGIFSGPDMLGPAVVRAGQTGDVLRHSSDIRKLAALAAASADRLRQVRAIPIARVMRSAVATWPKPGTGVFSTCVCGFHDSLWISFGTVPLAGIGGQTDRGRLVVSSPRR
jgi:hypothetical protein